MQTQSEKNFHESNPETSELCNILVGSLVIVNKKAYFKKRLKRTKVEQNRNNKNKHAIFVKLDEKRKNELQKIIAIFDRRCIIKMFYKPNRKV